MTWTPTCGPLTPVPVLSAEDEQQLAEQFYYHQDLDAARNLVMAHLRFVVHIARSYTGYGLPLATWCRKAMWA